MSNRQKNRKSFAVEKAMEFISSRIKNQIWQNGQRISDHRTLAEQAGVGQRTMWKAIHFLRDEKVISFKKNVGIYVGNKLPEKIIAPKPERILRWERLKNQLAADIFKGTFRGNKHIPASKELVVKYGVDFQTLKKALNALIEDEILCYDKRHYCIKEYLKAARTNAICLIVSELASNGNYNQPARDHFNDFVCSLEKTCVEKGIRLLKHLYFENIAQSIDLNIVLGFIVWNCEQMCVDIKENIKHHLLVYKKPVTIINPLYQTGKEICVQLKSLQGNDGHLFVSDTLADIRAGSEMGKFLIARGHKKIVYFNLPDHNVNVQAKASNWQLKIDYYDGLCKAFKDANIIDAVVPMYYDDLLTGTLDYLKTDKDMEHELAIKKEVAKLDKSLAFFSNEKSDTNYTEIFIHLFETKTMRNLRAFYAPLFRKALLLRDATAWVVSEDPIALYGAIEFLKLENINVPQQIAVAGFGDYPGSKMRNVTTWHYDFAGAAQKMVSMVLFPEYSRKVFCTKDSNFFKLDGMVFERGSA